MTIKSKIRVTVDITDANGKIQTFKQNLDAAGMSGQKAGQQVNQGMQQARTGIDAAGQSAVKASINFQTMGMGMLNLSTAGVQTFTSFSNLDRVQNRAAASAVGLARAEDLLARKTEQLTKLREAGNGAGRDAVLIMGEIETATADLAVKTDKLKIEQAAVTDVYLLFGANMMNVVVSSLMIYKTTMIGVTKDVIFNKIATIASTGSLKINSLVRWNNTHSLFSQTRALNVQIASTYLGVTATRVATVATKGLTLAMGGLFLPILAITAAITAYETNFMGFKDGVNSFLGIQEDFNEGIDDGTDGINAQNEALGKQKKAFEDMSAPMQEYIKLQEISARQHNDPRELIRLAKLRSGNFSSGVGTSSGGSGNSVQGSGGTGNGSSGGSSGAYQSNNIVPDAKAEQKEQPWYNITVKGNAAYADTGVPPVVYQHKPTYATDYGKNPFGTTEQKVAFHEMSYPEQRENLLSWIDNSYDNPGTQQAYITKYWQIFDESNGFTIPKKGKGMTSEELFKSIQQPGYAGIPTKSVFAPGFGGDGGIFDFKLEPREMIKKALGVDIGEIANVVNITDAIRIGSLQKTMGKYNAPSKKWLQVPEFMRDGKQVGNTMNRYMTTKGGDIPGIARILGSSTGLEGALAAQMQSVMNISNIGGRADEALREIYNAARASGWTGGSTGATAAYQTARGPGISQRAQRENAYNDMMANSGLGNRIKSAGNVFGVTQQLGMGYRSALPTPRHWEQYGAVTASARQFGSDEIAQQEMAAAYDQLQINLNSGRPGGIQPFINEYYEQTQQIAAASNSRAAAAISSLGINFNPNDQSGYYYKLDPRSRSVIWKSTAVSSEAQIRADILASSTVSLPSVSRLRAISVSFANNGNFTNFDNTAITQEAMATLGMTEQKVFDLRFNETRGDRELENRMRHIEQQAASSSGTSPL